MPSVENISIILQSVQNMKKARHVSRKQNTQLEDLLQINNHSCNNTLNTTAQ